MVIHSHKNNTIKKTYKDSIFIYYTSVLYISSIRAVPTPAVGTMSVPIPAKKKKKPTMSHCSCSHSLVLATDTLPRKPVSDHILNDFTCSKFPSGQ